MKRLALVVLPILSAIAVLGLFLVLARSQASVFGPRVAAVRKAIGHLVEEVAEEVQEVPA
jgi:hypothetical protein